MTTRTQVKQTLYPPAELQYAGTVQTLSSLGLQLACEAVTWGFAQCRIATSFVSRLRIESSLLRRMSSWIILTEPSQGCCVELPAMRCSRKARHVATQSSPGHLP